MRGYRGRTPFKSAWRRSTSSVASHSHPAWRREREDKPSLSKRIPGECLGFVRRFSCGLFSFGSPTNPSANSQHYCNASSSKYVIF
ncbi:Squalestatin S1 biosynthesis transcriptional activator L3 [Frankliniella fusca]|uniref:Squalestatin S1 biosynthesis transcriptional activator L3 n=1 Tax=Frankliniella fusca TaxID=407009 RepID=A0AAE1HCE1_9NEOP|nr:Squalestatin S1 biosynthesis transcriptional activator L3 [Frankliniella fusca]